MRVPSGEIDGLENCRSANSVSTSISAGRWSLGGPVTVISLLCPWVLHSLDTVPSRHRNACTSALDVGELLCDLPVAYAENVDAAYVPAASGRFDPVVAPPHHGTVPGDEHFF